jgi:SAM-dependent methyltransferase
MNDASDESLLTEVASYYSDKLKTYGENPRGVDWNGEEGQVLRFDQLTKIIEGGGPCSLIDVGCGYGAYFQFLSSRFEEISYLGIDVSEEMILAAQRRHAGGKDARFLRASDPGESADYVVASGIFNVRMGRSDEEWWTYLKATMDVLDGRSKLGFAFNCLTSYSDADKMRDYLYYADPCAVFDYCKRHYSRNVALLHDYQLYEFTILVRKQP